MKSRTRYFDAVRSITLIGDANDSEELKAKEHLEEVNLRLSRAVKKEF